MFKKITCITLLIFAMVPFLGGCSNTSNSNGAASTSQTAPKSVVERGGDFSSFKTYDIDGNVVTQDIFKDFDLTMINIWGTYCSPCIREMPDLGEIHDEYKDRKVNVVGIVIDVQNNDGSLSKSKVDIAYQIIEKTGADYLHIVPSNELINAKLKNVYSVPTTIFVDKNGNFVGKEYVGSKSKSEWTKVINDTLKLVVK